MLISNFLVPPFSATHLFGHRHTLAHATAKLDSLEGHAFLVGRLCDVCMTFISLYNTSTLSLGGVLCTLQRTCVRRRERIIHTYVVVIRLATLSSSLVYVQPYIVHVPCKLTYLFPYLADAPSDCMSLYSYNTSSKEGPGNSRRIPPTASSLEGDSSGEFPYSVIQLLRIYRPQTFQDKKAWGRGY